MAHIRRLGWCSRQQNFDAGDVWDRKCHGHKPRVAQTPEGAEPSSASTPQTALGNLEWSLNERGNGGLGFDVTCPSGPDSWGGFVVDYECGAGGDWTLFPALPLLQ
jgi:hypothetical protein